MKRFAGTFRWAQTSYFWRVQYESSTQACIYWRCNLCTYWFLFAFGFYLMVDQNKSPFCLKEEKGRLESRRRFVCRLGICILTFWSEAGTFPTSDIMHIAMFLQFCLLMDSHGDANEWPIVTTHFAEIIIVARKNVEEGSI